VFDSTYTSPSGSGIGSGGTITTSGSYTIHSFTTPGTSTFTISYPISINYLIVAGGGSGGVGVAGGGGAGGVLSGTTRLSAGSYTITVGAGGGSVFNDNQGIDGGSSSIGTLIVTTGGGGGGSWSIPNGRNGGSGGGQNAFNGGTGGGTGIAGQGFAGAPQLNGNTGGGGGGAGGPGSGSTGGIGITSNITGTTKYYAGGGGGGGYDIYVPGVAFGGTYQVANGTYGGGNGAFSSGTKPNFTDALANTGGGGGGQLGTYGNSGAGGSGIVVIRYLTNISVNVSSNSIDETGQWSFANVATPTLTVNTTVYGSDDRLKHNEVVITNGLDVIDKLCPKFYQKTQTLLDASYNGDLSGHTWNYEAGLIAQEVLQIPELSFVIGGGDYYEQKYNLITQTNELRNINYELSANYYEISANNYELSANNYEVSNILITQAYNLNYNSVFVYGLAAIKELHTKVKAKEISILNRQAIINSLMARIEALELARQDMSNNIE
jgi:hypothetical protein